MSPAVRDLASLTYRRAAACVGAVTGRTARRLDAIRGRVGVLMYHRVLRDDDAAAGIEPGMFVRASTFDRQLAWLRERWEIRTLGEALSRPPAAGAPPQVALTFDDGWRDNLTVAWPILREHGVRATIFVVRDWIAAGRHAGGEFMRPSELRELAEAGVEIGAHTVSHPRLDRLEPRAVASELGQSKAAVEDWTGRPCKLFAYPFGAHDDRVADVARDLFEASVVVGGGWWLPGVDPARLPRIGVHQDMTATRSLFASRLASARGAG